MGERNTVRLRVPSSDVIACPPNGVRLGVNRFLLECRAATMGITISIEIAAPVERIFELISDPQHMKRWMDSLEETTYVDGDDEDGPVGQKFQQKIIEAGKLVEYQGEVLVSQRPEHWGMRLADQHLTMLIDYRLSDTGSSTQLAYTCELEYPGMFVRWMFALFKPQTKRIVRGYLENLKRLAEAE